MYFVEGPPWVKLPEGNFLKKVYVPSARQVFFSLHGVWLWPVKGLILPILTFGRRTFMKNYKISVFNATPVPTAA